MTPGDVGATGRFELALAASRDQTCWELTLFVSGASALSARAIANAQSLCEVHLPGRHQLTVVDLHDDLDAVRLGEVVAAPTLVRHAPLPECRCVGDLSRVEKVRSALGLPAPGAMPRVPG